MHMSTKSSSVTSSSSKKQLALIAQPNGQKLVAIQTKTSTGTRLMTKWEFRRAHNLSRSEVEQRWPEYVKANAEAFNAQTAALIAAGKMHITSFAATQSGTITMKARTALPTAEEIKPTRKEAKVMDEEAALKALGLTRELLDSIKKQAGAPVAPAVSEKPADAPVAAPAPTLDNLLNEASKEAAAAK